MPVTGDRRATRRAWALQRAVAFCTCLLGALLASAPAGAAERCLACHADMVRGFAPAHGFAAAGCALCHAGDPAATVLPAAHRGLRAFPGQLDNAAASCGACHADKVAAVEAGQMHSGSGMVRTTRRTFGEPEVIDGHADLSHLGHGPADSLLRTQCASCHLGQPKREHRLDPSTDRGGGCLACHIDSYPSHGHPALSAKVSDARCFGCHSRSGRISLSYAGLAEAANPGVAGPLPRLDDGRAVEAHPADVHRVAGLGCTDCHTEVDVMSLGQRATHKAGTVDIDCADCHANRAPRLDREHWPAPYRSLLAKAPFAVVADTRFLATARHGTPLWNIELRADGTWLHPKNGGTPRRIPPAMAASHPLAGEHRRLSCAACHSQWAPQCHGCHLAYDASGEAWDFAAGATTAGVWHERRGGVRNELPPLGVDGTGRIVPVVPGMIMTLEHPAWPAPRFVRRFAPLSPHTTGPARACTSCHRSSTALGLGRGKLTRAGAAWRFVPAERPAVDGLPADAWTRLDRVQGGDAPDAARPFSAREMQRILGARLDRPATKEKR